MASEHFHTQRAIHEFHGESTQLKSFSLISYFIMGFEFIDDVMQREISAKHNLCLFDFYDHVNDETKTNEMSV